jgi:hypothetical protein
VAALYLELEPGASPLQVKNFILNKAGTALYDTGVDDDWDDFRSLKGGEVKHLYQPFSNPVPLKLTGVSL